jgi:hypothetical protein
MYNWIRDWVDIIAKYRKGLLSGWESNSSSCM